MGPHEAAISTPSPRSSRAPAVLGQAAWHMAWNASVAALRRSEAAARGAADQGAARIFQARRRLSAARHREQSRQAAALRPARLSLPREIPRPLQGGGGLRAMPRSCPTRRATPTASPPTSSRMSRPRTRGLRAAARALQQGEDERLPTLLQLAQRVAGKIECSSGAEKSILRARPTPDMRFAIFGDIHANLEALAGRARRRRGARGDALRLPRRHRRLQRQPARMRGDRARISSARW